MGKTVIKTAGLVLLLPVALLVVVVALPALAFYAVLHWCRGCWLRAAFRRKWGPENKHILLVYSESPNWQDYIEQNILPKLAPYAVTLNYSNRAEWKINKPLEAEIWEHWHPEKEINPIAIVFPDRGKVKTVKFFRAFRDFKHGKDRLLRQKEEELFSLLPLNGGHG